MGDFMSLLKYVSGLKCVNHYWMDILMIFDDYSCHILLMLLVCTFLRILHTLLLIILFKDEIKPNGAHTGVYLA